MVRLRELGERRLIRELWAVLRRRGLGGTALPQAFDDAVGLPVERMADGYLVLTNDGVAESTDMLPGMGWRELGWRLGVCCVSDLAAKGARPLGMLVSLKAPPDAEAEAIKEVYEGLADSAEEYGFDIWGGDIGEAGEVMLDGFLVGSSPRPLWRCGAKEGDVLVLSGTLGLTGAAFHYLLEGGRPADEESMRRILQAAYRPQARLRLGLELAKIDGVHAAIDLSDGLAESLWELVEACGLAAEVCELPVDPAAARYAEVNELDPTRLALYGGEEFELLIAVDPRYVDEVLDVGEKIGMRLSEVGRLKAGSGVFMLRDGRRVPIGRGWAHFRKPS